MCVKIVVLFKSESLKQNYDTFIIGRLLQILKVFFFSSSSSSFTIQPTPADFPLFSLYVDRLLENSDCVREPHGPATIPLLGWNQ